MEKLCWALILEQVKRNGCIITDVYGYERNSSERTFIGSCLDLNIPESCCIGFDTKYMNNNLYVHTYGEKLFKITIETCKILDKEEPLIKSLQIINYN